MPLTGTSFSEARELPRWRRVRRGAPTGTPGTGYRVGATTDVGGNEGVVFNLRSVRARPTGDRAPVLWWAVGGRTPLGFVSCASL